MSYRQQTSPSVCLFVVQSLNWVAEGMSNSFADTVQANDGGTHIHGGGSVPS
jgi:hypothetical protein